MRYWIAFCSFFFVTLLQAAPGQTALAVWANEAIIATYSYSYQNYLKDQKQIAHYFTAKGWMDYSKALNESGLPKTVQENQYRVSAVAVAPPEITPFDTGRWKVSMPILVVYRNPQYEQKQTLRVTLIVKSLPENQGVRGLGIESLQSVVEKPACSCDLS